MASEGSTSLTNNKDTASQEEDIDMGNSKCGIHIRHLAGVMSVYGPAIFLVLVVSFNLPFLTEEHHSTSGNSGIIISFFFLAIMTPDFFLNRVADIPKEKTKFYSFFSIGIGLALIWISPKEWMIAPGCILVESEYRVIQPIVYNQTTHTAIPRKVTLALAFVMTTNYLAILLCPFIIDFFQLTAFHTGSQQFALVFNLCISVMVLVISYTK